VLEVQQGPLNLRIAARTGGEVDRRAAEAAASAALAALAGLAPYRHGLSVPAVTLTPDATWPRVVRLMVEATAATGDATLTPMAAVAGSIAQVALEAGVAAGAGTMTVENGGDIALTVAPGERVRVGIARSIDDRRPTHRLVVSAGDGVGGVCSSGLGGRSFTQGVAEMAVAVAAAAALADAGATVLANATLVPYRSVRQTRAADLDPDTDIADLLVTTAVGALPDEVVRIALAQAERAAQDLIARGVLVGAFVRVRGRSLMVPSTLAEPLE